MKKDTVIDPQWEEEERLREAEREARRHPKRYARQQHALAETEGIHVVSDMIAPWDEPVHAEEKRPPRRNEDFRNDAPYIEEEANEMWLDPHNDTGVAGQGKEEVILESRSEQGGDLPGAALRPENDSSAPDEEDTPERPPSKWTKVKENIGSWLSGNILSHGEVLRLYPYLLTVAALMLFYISNIFYMQQLYRRQATLARDVKELRAKSLTVSSLRMTSTRQSEIIRELRRRGIELEELLEPPKVVK